MKREIKIPPRHKVMRAFRRVSGQHFVAACIWCGHGYRQFSHEIEAAHFRAAHQFSDAGAEAGKDAA